MQVCLKSLLHAATAEEKEGNTNLRLLGKAGSDPKWQRMQWQYSQLTQY